MSASQAHAYLSTLRRHVSSLWFNTWPFDSASSADSIFEAEMENRMREHLQENGSRASHAVPSHALPLTGTTLMDSLLLGMQLRASFAERPSVSQNIVLWAPSTDDCRAAACSRVPTSKLLLPSSEAVSAEVIKSIYHWFPDELRVQALDTRESLLRRIDSSSFLDDMRKLGQNKKKGSGGADRLNGSALPQPRRATFSVQASPVQTVMHSGTPSRVVNLYHYYGFEHARVMPAPLFDLAVSVWRASFSVLGEVSRVCPFTHCQLLLYYECFGCRINQHRDNANTHLLNLFLSNVSTGEMNEADWNASLNKHRGQVAGSNVVIFTLGSAPMQMMLRFPHADNLAENREDYVIHNTFRFTLSAGTIFVWDALDDLFFTHEAYFECDAAELDSVGESGWREAYVFRHVDLLDAFHCSSDRQHEMLHTAEHDAIEGERKRMKQRRVAKDRARLFNSVC